ncbi:hypothetical protein PV682_28915 [Streptomyces niveiscabiei]|uniref:hypothetical protein n=1 Tax=Streptomyces niveiscabiei TaxID=164115 RepID=UPI0029BAD401|nr:hypothetical protein [Streptomyces niveiscabiei]MDX3385454.1 hypothetical protein [Streptomyces niveiscabiei]
MTYRPHPSQITQVPPSYATPPPVIPQPPKYAPTLWTILLTATSVISLVVAATITRA